MRSLLIAVCGFGLVSCSILTPSSPTVSTPGALLPSQVVETSAPSPAEPTSDPLITPAPPTLPPEAPSATFTAQPTDTLTPVPPTPTATRWWYRSPTISPTPQPHQAEIRIDHPGLLSRVLSPIHVEGNAVPGPDGIVHLSLVGEDGTLLVDRTLRYLQTSDQRVHIQEDIKFQINGVAETARLVLSTTDRYNRTVALSSVDLVLLSIGDEQIYPPANLLDPFFIIRPYENEPFKGGILKIDGLVSPVANGPLFIQLVDEKGNLLANSTADIGLVTPERAYAPFQFDLPYSVSAVTRARLSLFQESDNRIPGVVALSSITVYLSP